ncbi:DUF3179 domain-containing protein [Halegenticoccus soli]|uniref:DUF3179 domain-containing protein n=1 Tax=Halegenticoccus soli TaxID=1985678 RepID=UPI000C6E28D9|nr:DUF3179 domain-containing protein [Halegenticoccus soli]
MNVRRVVPRDAIPSVDDPRFEAAYDGPADDEVVAVDLEGEARAYPVRYLHYHEIVNDRIGETAIAVTWCPLCGSAIAYDRCVGGGRVEGNSDESDESDARRLTFGVSGKLADDDLVMYDRETESEWKQSSGVCFAGECEGRTLRVLPAAVTTWQRFREAPPGGESEASGPGDDPEPIDYDADPYEAYFERDGFGLAAHRGVDGGRTWDREDVAAKAVVLGIERDRDAVGFPLPAVERTGGVVAATVGDADVVVFVADGVHAFENPGLSFEPADGGLFRADGALWDGATGESDDGRALSRLPARRLFAFAWQDDHGPDAFYGLSADGER